MALPRRLDAAAVAFAAVLPTAVTAIYFLALSHHPTGLQQAAWVLGKVGQFIFPAVWVLAVQRSRVGMGPGWQRGLGVGVASGAVVLVGILAAYHLWLGPAGVFEVPAVAMRAKLIDFGLDNAARYIAFAAFLSLAHSLLEEYYYRWFLFGQMRRLLPLAPAVAISSLAFTAHHVLVLTGFFGWTSPLTWLCVAGVGVGGAFWAWLYQRTGSLLGPWVSHLLVDVAIMAIGYELVLVV